MDRELEKIPGALWNRRIPGCHRRRDVLSAARSVGLSR